MKKIIVFLSVILFSTPLFAQKPFWHQTNGPEGGTVENITLDSSGNVIVWTAGSGVFRSSDNGTTWQLLNRGLPKAQTYLGAYSTTGYLIAANAAADGQVFRLNEKDPNAQWEEITPFHGAKSLTVNDILCDSDGKIYIAAGSLGVLRSDDTGTTWLVKGNLIDTVDLFPHVQVDANTFLLSTDGKGNIFVGLHGYGSIFRSSDKGDNWTKLPIRTPDGENSLLALVVSTNDNIIVGTQQRTLDIAGKIYVSTYLSDGDSVWKSKYQREANSVEQKNNIDKLMRVPGTNIIYANAHGPTLRTIDGGITWDTMDTDKRGDEIFSMVAKGNVLFQMCEPDGVFLSLDSGKTWDAKNKGMYAEYMWGVAVNSKQHLFAITEYGLWGSTDDGDSWDAKPEYGEDYDPSLFIDKKDSIFIGTNKGLFRSGNEGQTLTRVIVHLDDSVYGNDSLIHNIINQVGEDGRGKIFCASKIDSIGFRYSTDEGDTWINIPKLPQQTQSISTFAFSSQDTILAASGGLGVSLYYLSTDAGNTWRLLSNLPSNPLASQVLIDHSGAYLARMRGQTGGIYRSTDLAQTWVRIFPEEGVARTFKDYWYMMVDHSGRILVCTDSGVFRSTDAGFTLWSSVSEGLSANDVPNHFVTCGGLAENPVNHEFYAATHGLGVFKSDPDLNVVRGDHASPITAGVVKAYPNPFLNQSTISFTLPRSENITLELTDMLGREVQLLGKGQFAQGDHTVVLDGSALPSGNYMITLRNEEGNYTSWVTLVR